MDNQTAAQLYPERAQATTVGRKSFYCYDSAKGKPAVKIWQGRKVHPVKHFSFITAEQRAAYIRREVEAEREIEARRAERAAAAQAFDARDHFQPGDIVTNTWGYEQTNVDWYEVTAVSRKFVTVRPIEGNTTESSPMAMSGHTVPVPGAYTGPTERHGVHASDAWGKGGHGVTFKYGAGRKWDGKPQSCSWYG